MGIRGATGTPGPLGEAWGWTLERGDSGWSLGLGPGSQMYYYLCSLVGHHAEEPRFGLNGVSPAMSPPPKKDLSLF
jgi:hypothetical protein